MQSSHLTKLFKFSVATLLSLVVLLGAHLSLASAWLVYRLAAELAVVACAAIVILNPAFRRWLRPDPKGNYKGLRLPLEVAVHPSHCWARATGDSELTMGVDDLVCRSIGQPESVKLPEAGAVIREGEPLFSLERSGRTVTLRSPVSGKVASVNPALAGKPALLAQSPYGDGWLVKLAVDSPRRCLGSFQSGRDARDWFRAEVDRLLGAAHPDQLGSAAMADGGALVADFHLYLDDLTWKQVATSFFGDSADARPWPGAQLRHHGGSLVGEGDYYCFDRGDHVRVDGFAILPGEATKTWFRMPPLAFVATAPLFGLAYAIFLPFIGLAMLFAVGFQTVAAHTARATHGPRH